MDNINSFILERLKINNNTKLSQKSINNKNNFNNYISLVQTEEDDKIGGYETYAFTPICSKYKHGFLSIFEEAVAVNVFNSYEDYANLIDEEYWIDHKNDFENLKVGESFSIGYEESIVKLW